MMPIGLQIALDSYCKRLDSPSRRGIGARLGRPGAGAGQQAVAAGARTLR